MTETMITHLTSSNPNLAKPISFADTVTGRKTLNPTTIDLSTLPNPTLKEGEPALQIPTDLYQEGCKRFQHSLIARLDFTGLKFNEVKQTLMEQWKFSSIHCSFIPMSKCFFIVRLTNEADKEMIRGSKWMVNQHQLRMIDWYPGFNPEKQRTSHAATWVRFPGLHMELWTERSLLTIGKALGTPIVVDHRTLDLEYGHFAVVLVDIDFAKHIPERIHLSAGGRKFFYG
ncbi:uncharacterized protein LOC113343609 [Papaver somniferum]|uniref:uncharacterized protein LOC113343609 n=1 Tax=Papaver somniferum TaxID=3469 RepID=UPI000E6FD433|nr:uncharacterized protein LOC113343609 [Papaver somniferum]